MPVRAVTLSPGPTASAACCNVFHGAPLVPFFLQAVVGKPELVQADHVHPTLAGIDALVADTVDEVAAALPPA